MVASKEWAALVGDPERVQTVSVPTQELIQALFSEVTLLRARVQRLEDQW